MGRGRFFGHTAIAIATAALSSAGVSAQTANPNSPVVLDMDLVTSVDINNNRDLDVVSPGTTYSASETLSFGITSQTRVQVLKFSSSAALRFLDTPGDGSSFDFENPNLRLSYSREAADSNINLSASYRVSDVVDAIDGDEPTSEDLTPDTGSLTAYSASLNYQVGVNAPLGFSLNASISDRDYSDPTDPDLFDNSKNSIGVSASLRFSPVTQGILSASRNASSSDNAGSTDKVTTSYGFSVSHELRRALTLDATLGHRSVETTDFGVVSESSGFYGGIDAVQAMPNGSVFGGVNFDSSSSDDKISLTFGRSMDLPDGSLSASLTASQGDTSGTQFLGSLNYVRDLPTGAVSVGLSQSITSNAADEDVKFSKLGIGYSQELTAASGLNLALDLSRSEDAGGGTVDTKNRADFTASYSRELTPEWDLSLGYKHRRYTVTGSPTASSDSLFLTLSRSLALGF